MASLIVVAFLSCSWFTSSLGQIVPLIGMSRSHYYSNSSFIISQKLCSTQQAATTVQQLFKFRSSRFASTGSLPFNLPYLFSTTTLVMCRILLNCNSSTLRFPQSTYGFISQPLIVSYPLLPRVKPRPQRDMYSEECTFPGHPTQTSKNK